MADAFRRALAEADAAHRAAMPAFGALLAPPTGPGAAGVDRPAARRVADRRTFLRAGGLVAVGAALAACGGGDDDSGDGAFDVAATGRSGPVAGDLDLTVAAARIERTVVAAYAAVIETRGPDLEAAGLAETALLLRDHHREHAGALDGLLADNGVGPDAEDVHFAGLVVPDADAMASMAVSELVALARGLEDRATQTYLTSVPRLTVPALRQALMSIGAVEARHVAALDLLAAGGLGGYTTTAATVIGGSYPTDDSLLYD